jgi:hypothetical protein
LVFYTSYDITTTRSGRNLEGKDWKLIGTDSEGALSLERYLSYDEMQISALIGVSSPTFFINNGNRYNVGIRDRKGNYQREGIYVGLVGARFEKPRKMESQHILIFERNDHKGVGINISEEDMDSMEVKKSRLWAKFYDQKYNDTYSFPTYTELTQLIENNKVNPNDYLLLKSMYSGNKYFNVAVYKKRIKMSVETFLVEANDRGRAANKRVYVHTVGLGLGVWQICSEQGKWSVDVYADVIKERKLQWISDLDFSWFPSEIMSCDGTRNGQRMRTDNGNSIRIHFSKRDPACSLDNPDKILVACYAWDSNSFPGNEYWRGALSASGDPAAASCSLIPELQNPYVNTSFLKNIWSCPLDDSQFVDSGPIPDETDDEEEDDEEDDDEEMNNNESQDESDLTSSMNIAKPHQDNDSSQNETQDKDNTSGYENDHHANNDNDT